MHSKRYESGLEMRKQVLGAEQVETTMAAADPRTQPLQEIVNEFVWGSIWARPGLAPKHRSMLTVGLLTALNRSQELRTHLRGALNNGVAPEELVEILLHTSVYCGFPAAVEGFRALQEILKERA
jgi:4-carboxymuconolactone decarboxylase